MPHIDCCDNCAGCASDNTNIQLVAPSRRAVQNIVDIIFGDCVFCDCDHEYDSYDETDIYNGSYYEHSDRSCSDEDERESDKENAYNFSSRYFTKPWTKIVKFLCLFEFVWPQHWIVVTLLPV